jgi:hypothetical protein
MLRTALSLNLLIFYPVRPDRRPENGEDCPKTNGRQSEKSVVRCPIPAACGQGPHNGNFVKKSVRLTRRTCPPWSFDLKIEIRNNLPGRAWKVDGLTGSRFSKTFSSKPLPA